VREFAAAGRRKDRAVAEARSQASKRRGRVLDDDDDGLSTKDRDKLDADIETARQNYSRLLQERQDKSYRAPIRDAKPTVLYNSYPTYTEKARRNKTSGSVKLRVEFRADGKIGNVTVVRGLGDGLDEKAVEAVRRMVFLPATKDRVFVTFYVPVDADFSLR
jgi:TonB family protein